MKSVFQSKEECCACGACMDVCPVKAINLQEDEQGFLYPKINQKQCVDCGMCQRVCPILHHNVKSVQGVFAGIDRKAERKKYSASGGVFTAIASAFLEDGGAVCGAALIKKDHLFENKHVIIKKKEDLFLLQGSKYVQSNTENIYREVEKILKKNTKVLFSGTPCQVAGLYGYLRKEYDNLYTIDLICHGVPSSIWWKKSLQFLLSDKSQILEIKFRDNDTWSQGPNGHITYVKNDKIIRKGYNRNNTYYDLFLKGEIFRDSCYSCPFAQAKRVGDVTLGDFWGFSEEYNQKIIEKENNVDLSHGNSCILVNSLKGKLLIDNSVSKTLWIYPVEFEKIQKYNPQLQIPSRIGKNRNKILLMYKIGGYKLVDLYCQAKRRLWKFIYSK